MARFSKFLPALAVTLVFGLGACAGPSVIAMGVGQENKPLPDGGWYEIVDTGLDIAGAERGRVVSRFDRAGRLLSNNPFGGAGTLQTVTHGLAGSAVLATGGVFAAGAIRPASTNVSLNGGNNTASSTGGAGGNANARVRGGNTSSSAFAVNDNLQFNDNFAYSNAKNCPQTGGIFNNCY